mmetsp:Transcript_119292/g.338238  ORF Transcript_119292/g.338238 Transcript_119292/m.338238 type:complete len:136 (-) Transcript_119292:42-449(-)
MLGAQHAGAAGAGGLGSSGLVAGASRPGTSGSLGGTGNLGDSLSSEAFMKQDMLQKGYLPTEEYIGIMAYNKELFTQNKQLRAEFVTIQVEHERLRMEESFLREGVLKAGLSAPPEVAGVADDRVGGRATPVQSA